MVAPPPTTRDDEGSSAGGREVETTGPKTWAAGIPAVAAALRRSYDEMGAGRTAKTLLRLNQRKGYDCPGCAWPDPDRRKPAEFCENGAKHVAAEATRKEVGPAFFREHSLSSLAQRSDWWLEEQGRLTHPVVKRAGSDHYEPVSWDEAFDVIATELNALDSPDEAIFYTSGRTSNEAAFAYQLFVRAFGTNNLPDCSNMCHESTGAALGEIIGVGKGSTTLDDLHHASLIIICGQNPGSNHPRMMSHLQNAKRNGATIVAVNPMPEAGLLRFKDPQSPVGMLGSGTALADLHLSVRLAGDQALFLGLGKLVLEAADRDPSVLDTAFLEKYTSGFDDYASHVRAADWETIETASGLSRDEIKKLADLYLAAPSTIICWAMGVTQHRDSVAIIKELVNPLLLKGNIGRLGAGVFPVRGHSNVQGDRTMGIWEKMPDAFLDALQLEFGFEPPRHHGLDAVDSIAAMRDGRAKVFVSMGGNLVRAISDTTVAEAAMRRLRLTVNVATKLNRSHVTTGEISVLLPTLGRTEHDVRPGGEQFVTVEDSVGHVHSSTGVVAPASPHLRSEMAIISGLARRTLGDKVGVDWETFADDYDAVRDSIGRVIPSCNDYNAKVRRKNGFVLPHAARDERRFQTSDGLAHLTVNELNPLTLPPGRLLLQTMRSHDQFNTSVYGPNDRYRGVHGGREVVFVAPEDLAQLGLVDGDRVDVVSEWVDGVDRRVTDYRVIAYPMARDCAAAYYPETNVLVPLDSVAIGSNTPTSKSVVVRLEKRPATD